MATAKRHADERGEGEPEQHLHERHERVVPEQRPVVAQRLEGLDGRGQRQVVHRLERGHPLPGEHEQRDQEGSEQVSHRPSASSTRALELPELGARHVARPGELHRDLRHHAAGPRREHRDPVGEERGLLHVVGHEQHGARLVGERVGQPALHRRAGERVERPRRARRGGARGGRAGACAGRPRAGASRRTARPGARSRTPRARSARTAARRGGAPPRAARPGTRARARRSRARRATGAGGRAAACRRSRRGAPRRRWRPARVTVPASGSCSPATSSSSVDLPQPDGPTTAISSSCRTARSIPSRAVTLGTAASRS